MAEFVAHLTAEIQRIDGEITEVYAKYSIAKEEANRIQEILAEAHGEVTLQTVIESEDRRAADNLLAARLESLRQTRVDVQSQANQLKEEIEDLNKRAASLRRERLDEYSRYLRKNFLSLDVRSYSASSGEFVGDGECQRAVLVRNPWNLRQVESKDLC